MKKFIVIALALLAPIAAVAAQTSKYGAPTWHVPYAGAIQPPSSKVANLPLCDGFHIGAVRVVTDATAPSYNGALTGGGAVVVTVLCNGSSWTSQ